MELMEHFGYGYKFQSKLLAAILKLLNFLLKIIDVLKPLYFDNECFKWLYNTINVYYMKYRTPISIDVIYLLAKALLNVTLLQSIMNGIKEILSELLSLDLLYIKDMSIKFLKFQTLKQAILLSVDLLPSLNYDVIQSKINNAINVGSDVDLGKEFFEGFLDRYRQTNRRIVPSPWPVINLLMNGGLGRGLLGIIAAPPGIGKCIDGDMNIDIRYKTLLLNGQTYYPWLEYLVFGVKYKISKLIKFFQHV